MGRRGINVSFYSYTVLCDSLIRIMKAGLEPMTFSVVADMLTI